MYLGDQKGELSRSVAVVSPTGRHFFPSKDSPNEKPWILCLLSPPIFLSHPIKSILLPLCMHVAHSPQIVGPKL